MSPSSFFLQLYNASGSVGVAVQDDSPGNDDAGKDNVNWNAAAKKGTFWWQWSPASTDGMAIGPMNAFGWYVCVLSRMGLFGGGENYECD
jgi:hypothetical protein